MNKTGNQTSEEEK